MTLVDVSEGAHALDEEHVADPLGLAVRAVKVANALAPDFGPWAVERKFYDAHHFRAVLTPDEGDPVRDRATLTLYGFAPDAHGEPTAWSAEFGPMKGSTLQGRLPVFTCDNDTTMAGAFAGMAVNHAKRAAAESLCEATDALPDNADALLRRVVPGKLRALTGLHLDFMPRADYASSTGWGARMYSTDASTPSVSYSFSVTRPNSLHPWEVALQVRSEFASTVIADGHGPTVNDALKAMKVRLDMRKVKIVPDPLSVGTKVRGVYFGQAFTGAISPRSSASTSGISVNFDKPLHVHGTDREGGYFDTWAFAGAPRGAFRDSAWFTLAEAEAHDPALPAAARALWRSKARDMLPGRVPEVTMKQPKLDAIHDLATFRPGQPPAVREARRRLAKALREVAKPTTEESTTTRSTPFIAVNIGDVRAIQATTTIDWSGPQARPRDTMFIMLKGPKGVPWATRSRGRFEQMLADGGVPAAEVHKLVRALLVALMRLNVQVEDVEACAGALSARVCRALLYVTEGITVGEASRDDAEAIGDALQVLLQNRPTEYLKLRKLSADLKQHVAAEHALDDPSLLQRDWGSVFDAMIRQHTLRDEIDALARKLAGTLADELIVNESARHPRQARAD